PEPPDYDPDGHPRNPAARIRSPTPGIRSRAAILETRALGKPSWASGKQFSRSDSFPRCRARSFRVGERCVRVGAEIKSSGVIQKVRGDIRCGLFYSLGRAATKAWRRGHGRGQERASRRLELGHLLRTLGVGVDFLHGRLVEDVRPGADRARAEA